MDLLKAYLGSILLYSYSTGGTGGGEPGGGARTDFTLTTTDGGLV